MYEDIRLYFSNILHNNLTNQYVLKSILISQLDKYVQFLVIQQTCLIICFILFLKKEYRGHVLMTVRYC